jgi:hypothetical protein
MTCSGVAAYQMQVAVPFDGGEVEYILWSCGEFNGIEPLNLPSSFTVDDTFSPDAECIVGDTNDVAVAVAVVMTPDSIGCTAPCSRLSAYPDQNYDTVGHTFEFTTGITYDLSGFTSLGPTGSSGSTGSTGATGPSGASGAARAVAIGATTAAVPLLGSSLGGLIPLGLVLIMIAIIASLFLLRRS